MCFFRRDLSSIGGEKKEDAKLEVMCIYIYIFENKICTIDILLLGVSKNSGYPKMDGENNGKPY